MNLHSPSKSNTKKLYANSLLYFDMFVFHDWPFPHVYFAKNVAYFPFNSWLSFQRLSSFMGEISVRNLRWLRVLWVLSAGLIRGCSVYGMYV